MTGRSTDLLTYDDYRAVWHFDALDGLRGLSVLFVFTWHLRTRDLAWLHGASGVSIFFVLSGMLITTLGLREEEIRGRLNIRAFYVRRAARILPVFLLAMAAYCLAVLVFHLDPRQAVFVSALPFYLIFSAEIPLFQNGFRPFPVAWSLGIEEKFYLVWPILGFRVLRSLRARLIGSIGIILVAYVAYVATPTALYTYYYAEILIGAVLAFLMHDRRCFDRLRFLTRPAVASGAAFVALAWMIAAQAPPRPLTIVFPFLVALALPGIVAGSGIAAAGLSNRALRWLGDVSYAFYLLHPLALLLAQKIIAPTGEVSDLVHTFLTIDILLPTVALVHRYIEKPCLDLGRAKSRAFVERAASTRSDG